MTLNPNDTTTLPMGSVELSPELQHDAVLPGRPERNLQSWSTEALEALLANIQAELARRKPTP